MRLKILYLFYAVVTVFIFISLGQDFSSIVRTTSGLAPRYIFNQQTQINKEDKKQEDLKVFLKWASNPNSAKGE